MHLNIWTSVDSYKFCCKEKFSFVIVLIAGTFAGLATKNFADSIHFISDLGSLGPNPDFITKRKAWIADLVLKIAVSLMLCAVYVAFAIHIRSSLTKSIRFLERSNGSARAILGYQRIIKFTTIICTILVIYNAGIRLLERSLFLYGKLLAYHQKWLYGIGGALMNYPLIRAMEFMKYMIKALMCAKPTCFLSTYIWMRYNCTKPRS